MEAEKKEEKHQPHQEDNHNQQHQNKNKIDVDYEQQQLLIEQQQQIIRNQIEQESPLIGDKKHISAMLDQFINNQGFYIKVQKMHDTYQYYRKTRRDGSCFYRALTFSIMEAIYIKHDQKLQQHILKKLKDSKQFLLKANFEGIIFEDIQDLFLQKLKDPLIKNIDDVIAMMCDPEISNYLVLMLRFLTSGEMKVNASLYQTFIDDQIPIEIFCQLQVEPIDKEADQIQIMALLNYLQVGIKIIYLDSNTKNKQAYQVILPENTSKQQIKATLLYRPGHYDILYS